MTEYSKGKNPEAIEREACEWLAVMSSDAATPDEAARFEAWLDADPCHRSVYGKTQAVWGDLAGLQDSVAEGNDHLHEPALSRNPEPHYRDRFPALWHQRPLQAAASLAVLAVTALLVLYLTSSTGNRIPNGEIATQTAEIREIVLPDGSTVTVGAQSAIDIQYTGTERRVELMAGEAFFSVVKDPVRPFRVSATNAEIRVVGTQFDVRRSGAGLRVAVLEGRVEILPGHNHSEKKSRILAANQKIRIISDAELPEPQSMERELPGAWRQGRLIYEDAKLSEVIADADRYYGGNIILDTEGLEDLVVSASFRSDQINKMMQTLSAVLPITVKPLSNGDILLRRKSPAEG